jgi:glycosyltransferase involved in cell wall biosynthesis
MTIVSHAIETFSIAALESMAMGKPMVMSKVGGAEEQVEEGWNGYVFSPGDIDQLTKHLEYLSDEKIRMNFSAQAREGVVGRFSLPVMLQDYENALISVIGDL